MKKDLSILATIQLTAVAALIPGGGALLIWGDKDMALSFALGVGVAFLYLYLLYRQANRLRSSTPDRAKRSSVQALSFRYLIVIAAFFLASRMENLNLYLVFVGLLLIPLSSVVLYLFGSYPRTGRPPIDIKRLNGDPRCGIPPHGQAGEDSHKNRSRGLARGAP